MKMKISSSNPINQKDSTTKFEEDKKTNLDNYIIDNNNMNNNNKNIINKISDIDNINNIKDKEIFGESIEEEIKEPVEEMNFDKKLSSDFKRLTSVNKRTSLITLNSIIKHEDLIKSYKVKVPKSIIKDQILILILLNSIMATII